MKKFFLSLFLCLTFIYSFSQKDTIDYEKLWNLSLEELMDIKVTGFSRYKQNISEVPNNIMVITQQMITERGYFDVYDALKDVLGIDISSNAGQFGEWYALRGISPSDRFLLLINGHKINPASGTFISIGNSISIKYVERIEVIFGPASAVYGADAFSGIINIIISDNMPANNFQITSYVKYGSLNSKDAAISSSIKFSKDFYLNFSARYYQSDGPNFEGTDTTFYNYNIVNKYISPLVNSFEQPSFDHSIFFNLNYKKFSINYYRQYFNEGNALTLTPFMYIYNKENKWETSTDMVWLTYKNQISEKSDLKIDFSYKHHNQNKNSIYYKWLIPGQIGETYKQYMTGLDNSFCGVVSYNTNIGKKIQMILGIENEYNISIPPYANDQVLWVPVIFEGQNADIIKQDLTITENRAASFFQLYYSPATFVDFIVGARYDFSTRYGGTFNPRLGFILKPFYSTRINFVYGRAFLSPSLFYQYEQWGAPNIAMISTDEIKVNNPDWNLSNQIVNTFEFSFIQKIGKNIEFKAVAYHNTLNNLIVRNLFAPYPQDSVYNKYFNTFTSGLRNENIGKQNIYGIEGIVNAKISKNIILYTYYSYTYGVSISQQNVRTKIPRVSPHKVWAGLTFQNLFGFLTISPRYIWVSEMYNLNTLVFPNNIQPGFSNLDINISINNLAKHFTIFADFDNVLNSKIEHGGVYGQDVAYTATIPQQGFNFNVGMEVKF